MVLPEGNPNYKILIMFPSLEDKGGVVSFCRLLMENLASPFHVEHLMIGNRPGNQNLMKRLSFIFHDSLSLKRMLVREKNDIIHLNPSLKILSLLRDSFYLSVIKRFHPGKTVVMFHGWNEFLAEKIIRNHFYRKFFKGIYENVDLILVLCKQFREQLIKMGIRPGSVRIITTMYKGTQVQTENHKKKANNVNRILFMARLVKSKGVYIAADVGRLLVENGYKNIKLTFAGDGPELGGLREYITQHGLDEYIDTPGYLTGEIKWKTLEENDIFLYPSYYGEGCPIVILEAMGSGLAVISSSLAAIPEIVKNNENGFIIGSRDPKEFFVQVKKLIENRELLKKMQNLNKKKAEELYDAKVVTKKIEALYLATIDKKREN